MCVMSSSDEKYDGYWWCPSGKVYPRYNDRPMPEEGCLPEEPVVVSEDGTTASGVVTGVTRPVPTVAQPRPASTATQSLPSTGSEGVLLVIAVALGVAGASLRRLARA